MLEAGGRDTLHMLASINGLKMYFHESDKDRSASPIVLINGFPFN
jgi:hypothetical protein